MVAYSLGNAIVDLVTGGIQAKRGYPGELMPYLTEAVAAVNIYKSEPGKVTYVAETCAPMSMGVYACEDLAQKIAEKWTEKGGVCTFGNHTFDGKSGLYMLPVYGVWVEETEEETTEESA